MTENTNEVERMESFWITKENLQIKEKSLLICITFEGIINQIVLSNAQDSSAYEHTVDLANLNNKTCMKRSNLSFHGNCIKCSTRHNQKVALLTHIYMYICKWSPFVQNVKVIDI